MEALLALEDDVRLIVSLERIFLPHPLDHHLCQIYAPRVRRIVFLLHHRDRPSLLILRLRTLPNSLSLNPTSRPATRARQTRLARLPNFQVIWDSLVMTMVQKERNCHTATPEMNSRSLHRTHCRKGGLSPRLEVPPIPIPRPIPEGFILTILRPWDIWECRHRVVMLNRTT